MVEERGTWEGICSLSRERKDMSIEFKRKLSGSNTADEDGVPIKSVRLPPAYGSQRYWEDRYSQQFQKVLGTMPKVSDAKVEGTESFAW